MLRFKARRKPPTLAPELTASQRRMMRYFQDAARAIRETVGRDLNALANRVVHDPATRIAADITVEPWIEAQALIQNELLAELLDGGSRVSITRVSKADAAFVFDRDRPEAATWAALEAGRLIQGLTEEQLHLVRSLVESASLGERTPLQVARSIRDSIGLTEQQAQWVDNRWSREYQAQVSAGVSVADAERAADRAAELYYDRTLRYRSETIARTEILNAAHEGRREAWQQGIQDGWINPEAQKQWMTVDDPCDLCAEMDGVTAPVNGEFPNGDPPLHPNCRCDVLLIDEVPADISELTDEELDAQIAELLGGESATDEAEGPEAGQSGGEYSQELRDALGEANMTPEELEERFANAESGQQAYIRDYDRQEEHWRNLMEQDVREPHDAAMAWGSQDYKDINAVMSGDGSTDTPLRQSGGTIGEFVQNMDEAFNMSPTRQEDIVVNRATNSYYPSIRELTEAEPGAKFQSDQYMATTMQGLDKMRLGGISGDVEFQILVPAYSRGALNIDAVTYSGTREYEILLDKGSSFVLVDKRFEEGRWKMRLLLTR